MKVAFPKSPFPILLSLSGENLSAQPMMGRDDGPGNLSIRRTNSRYWPMRVSRRRIKAGNRTSRETRSQIAGFIAHKIMAQLLTTSNLVLGVAIAIEMKDGGGDSTGKAWRQVGSAVANRFFVGSALATNISGWKGKKGGGNGTTTDSDGGHGVIANCMLAQQLMAS